MQISITDINGSAGKGDVWKSRYFWLEDCLLTVYGEDPTSFSTAKPIGNDLYDSVFSCFFVVLLF